MPEEIIRSALLRLGKRQSETAPEASSARASANKPQTHTETATSNRYSGIRADVPGGTPLKWLFIKKRPPGALPDWAPLLGFCHSPARREENHENSRKRFKLSDSQRVYLGEHQTAWSLYREGNRSPVSSPTRVITAREFSCDLETLYKPINLREAER